MIEILAVLGMPLAGALALALIGERDEAPIVNVIICGLTLLAAAALTVRVISTGPLLVAEHHDGNRAPRKILLVAHVLVRGQKNLVTSFFGSLQQVTILEFRRSRKSWSSSHHDCSNYRFLQVKNGIGND